MSRFRLCHNCHAAVESGLSRCEQCRNARRSKDRKRRRSISRAVFPAELRQRFLNQIAAGRPFGEAVRVLQLSSPLVHGFARTHPLFRRELDAALIKGRRPDLEHGSATTYRLHGCRCPDCRKAKRRAGAWSQ